MLQKTAQITDVLRNHEVVFAGLFGSRAKNSATQTSDYDFLIEFSPNKKYTLLDIVSVKESLEQLLNAPVDVVTTRALHPYIKENVLNSLQTLYDERS